MTLHLSFDRRTLNPSQRLFLNDTDSPFLLMSAGFGAGKTTIGALKAIRMAADNPGVPGLIVAQSWTALKSTPYRALKKFFPNGHKPRIIDPSGERYIEIGGSTIFLRTAHNPELMDGLDVGWVWGDEIRHYTKRAYDIMIGRVRLKCATPQRFFTSTPSVGWMSEEFDSGKANRRVIFTNSAENAHNLADDYVENMRLSYSKRMQKAVIEGRFTVLEGSVYEAFDTSLDSDWVVEYDVERSWQDRTYLFIDPGYRRPAVLWVRRMGRVALKWVVFHQMYYDDLSTFELVQRINAWNRDNGVKIDEVWVDPAATQVSQAVDTNVVKMLKQIQKRGAHATIRHLGGTIFAEITYGVEKTRVMLGDPEIGQEPHIYFSKQLMLDEIAGKYGTGSRGIIRSLAGYRYPEAKDGRAVDDRPLKDGIYDHMCDALRYGCVGLFVQTPDLRRLETDSSIKNVVPAVKVV